jgi:hypothetical protein
MEVFDHIFQTGHSRTDIADDNDDFVIAFDAWQSEGKKEGNRGLYTPVSPSNLLSQHHIHGPRHSLLSSASNTSPQPRVVSMLFLTPRHHLPSSVCSFPASLH